MKKFSFIKINKQVNELDKAAAKHLVKLGVEKDWKDCYRRIKLRRKRKGKI